MPVYNSLISSPRIRLGHYHGHHKSSRTTSPVMDLAQGEMTAVKDKSKRRSLTESPRSSASSIRSVSTEPTISMTIESPPLVCYGPPKESTGCLLSGLIHLITETSSESITSFTLILERTVTHKHPVVHNCPDCRSSTTVLNTWHLISLPTTLRPGDNSYPFSYLFPGDTPASCDNALSTISYTLRATAITADGTPLTFSRPITIQRSILPGPEKHSIRIFPPTHLTATLTHPSVVHPGGDFLYSLTLSGVLNRPKNTRWRLRKLTHRIEEHSKALSVPCARHVSKLLPPPSSSESSEPPKGVAHEDIRVLATTELKRGWKSDFENADGKIELETTANIPPYVNACCKTEVAENGIEVKHVLVVECVVAEEYMATTHSRGATPTGAARVLRMQFQLNVTARSGLGISWDEEAPPMYEDIPAGPPTYEMPPGYEQIVTQTQQISIEDRPLEEAQ